MLKIVDLLNKSTEELSEILNNFPKRGRASENTTTSTVVLVFKGDNFEELGKIFSRIMGYTYKALNEVEETAQYLSKTIEINCLLFSEASQLRLNFLQKMINLSCEKGINLGIMTGENYRSALIFALKNIIFSSLYENEPYTSFQIVPRRENKNDLSRNIFSIYSNTLKKSDITEGELNKLLVCRKSRHTASDGKILQYEVLFLDIPRNEKEHPV
ncbi:glycoside hydrolase family 25 domain-containing protein [Lactovum odontotermitis]